MEPTTRDAAFADHANGKPRRWVWNWLPFIALSILLFEWTADPALSMIVLCVKLGGGDFLTAWWLRRNDPEPIRGKVCSWFFVATAFLRIGAAAVSMIMLTAVIAGIARWTGAPAMHEPPRSFLGALILTISCYALTAFSSWMALGSAWWHGIRVWADTKAGLARKQDAWPPFPIFSPTPRFSSANIVLFYAGFSAGLVTMVGFLFLSALVLVRFVPPVPLNAPPPKDPFFVLTTLILAVVLASSFFLARRIYPRIMATSPISCYPLYVVKGWEIPTTILQAVVNADSANQILDRDLETRP